MDLNNFYERILPPNGPYCNFRASIKTHIWADTIGELVEYTNSLADVPDLYFATASFLTSDNRTQLNVAGKKCFYLDLDAGEKKLAKQGPEKVYENQQAALADFVRFTKETGLLPSMIVSSGEGLHIYYALDDTTDPLTWTPVAKQLHKFAVAHGVKSDSAVPSDSVRILRPIGTMHPNGKRVTLLKDTGKVYSLDEFKGAIAYEPEPEVSRFSGMDDINADLGLTVQGPPKSIKKLLKSCANAQWAYLNQDKVEEPYWRAMIGLTVHTIEGIDAAHAVSCKHPEYDAERVEAKFARWTTGPTTCATLEDCNKSACASCPHKGKIKSPIVLGALNVEETEALPEEDKPQAPEPTKSGNRWDDHIPKGFDVVQHRGRRTLVHYFDTERENENGEMVPIRVTVPITNEVFWFGHWSDAENDTDVAQFTLYRLDEDNNLQTFVMRQELLASRSEFIKFLAGRGIHTTTDKRAAMSLEHYGKALAQQVKMQQRRIKVTDHFGLRNLPDGRLVAVQGNYVIFPDGRISTAILGPALQTSADAYTLPLIGNERGEWEPSVWAELKPKAKQHVDFLRKYYGIAGMERYQLAIAMGLASPLMAFAASPYEHGSALTPGGITVTMFSSESARGKSAVMNASIIAYGNPAILSKARDKSGATGLARTARLSQAGTMPAVMDEMGDVEPAALNDLIKSIANGNARERATQTGGLSVSPPWALICLMGTNHSQREILSAQSDSTDATQHRLLEINCEDMPKYDMDAREAYQRDWDKVYPTMGALGGMYHLLIARTGSARLREMMVNATTEAARRLGIDNQSARFVYRALACVLVLRELSEAAGLFPFEIEPLIAAFKTSFDAGIEEIESTTQVNSPLQQLSAFLHDMIPYTVVTREETSRSQHVTQYDDHLGSRMPDVVKVRHIVSSEVSYVSTSALREWCRVKKAPMSLLIGSAKRSGVLRRVYACREGQQWQGQFNLLKGMRNNNQSYIGCYAIHTASLAQALGVNPEELLGSTLKHKDNVVSIETAAA